MTKKVVYITNIDLDAPNHKGVKNKISGQLTAFQNAGISTVLIHRSKNEIVALQNSESEIIGRFSSNWIIRQFQRLYFFRYLIRFVSSVEPDGIYIRYPLSSKDLFQFMKKVPGKKVIEIPTYPYEQEFRSGLRNRLDVLIDRQWNKRVSKLTNRYVTIGEAVESIHEVETIQISNGFHWGRDIPEVKPEVKPPYQVVFIGNPMPHHGMEYLKRFSNPNLSVHVIGNSDYLDGVKGELNNLRINFYDYMEEDKLSAFLSKMDVAISTLTPHVKKHSPLKSRIYALHGIPFIYNGIDEDFKGQSFAHKIHNIDEMSPQKVYDIVLSLISVDRKELQNYALTTLSWNNKMQPVIDYVKG